MEPFSHVQGHATGFGVQVDSHDDDSVVRLSKGAIEQLGLHEGDFVLVQNDLKKHRVPYGFATSDDTPPSTLRLNTAALNNLRLNSQDKVTLSKLSSPSSAVKISVAIIAAPRDNPTSLRDDFVCPYFQKHSRPINIGDLFTSTHNGTSFDFCVTNVVPAPYAFVTEQTTVDASECPITKEEAEQWYTKGHFNDLSLLRTLWRQRKEGETEGVCDSMPALLQVDTESKTEPHSPSLSTATTVSPGSPPTPNIHQTQSLPSHFRSPSWSSALHKTLTNWPTESHTAVKDFAHFPEKPKFMKKCVRGTQKLFTPIAIPQDVMREIALG